MKMRHALVATAMALCLAAAACGNDSGDSGNDGSGTASGGSLTLSGQDFTEMQIMAAMYDQLLTNAGYDVTTKLVGTRDIYLPQLESGDVDVVPEYLSGLADQLNVMQNGANAKPVTNNDPQESLKALQPLAAKAGITMLDPAEATDQNAFAVTKEFAQQNNLTTLSDLGALGQPITLAAAPDCQGRDDCQAGLEGVYHIDITKILPLGFGTPQTIDSVTSGESQLGLVATTQADLDQSGLVILEDDKGIQPAQNLIPAVNTEFLNQHPDVADVLNELASVLTTEDPLGSTAMLLNDAVLSFIRQGVFSPRDTR